MKIFLLLFILNLNFVFAQNHIKFENSEISIEKLLQKYIQIPSVSGNEMEAGNFIKSVCKENGLIVSDFGSSNGNFNFAASIYPLTSKKPNIIFLNHIDVVPETNQSDHGPYSGTIENGEVFGRGAIDNKGVALMQLYSIIQLLNNNSLKNGKYNVTFLAVSCEETQCKGGINYVLDNYFDLLNPAMVIGEGASELTSLIGGNFKHPIFGVSVAQKRAFWLELELENHTIGHGSITPLSYANKDMVTSLHKVTKKKNKAIFNDLNVSFLKALAVHKKGIEKIILKHPKIFKAILVPKLRKQPEIFALFSNTITLTNIVTNNKTFNKIPSKVSAHLDCRLLPDTDVNVFLNDIKKRLNNNAIKIKIVENMPPSKPSSIQNLFYRNLEKAIIQKYPKAEILPIMLPNINDLSAFRFKNIIAYATVPVFLTREHIENVHNDNEHITIQSLEDGTEVYNNFLVNMEMESGSE